MIPHFTIQQGKQQFLMVRDADAFHIIDINEALTQEKRNAILESGCTPVQMQEMGLSGMTIPRADITAITITGSAFQDEVIFYLGRKKKMAFWFPKAYEQKRVDDFFRGIPRIQYKTRFKLKRGKNMDWRDRERDPATARKMRPVGIAFNCLGVGMFLLPLLVRIPLGLWIGIVLAVCFTAIVLDTFFPAYFSLVIRGKQERKQDRGKVTSLGFGVLMPLYPLFLKISMTIHVFDEFRLLPTALLMTVLTAALLFLFCREFRESAGEGLLTLFFVFVFCWFVFAPYFNHAFGPDPVPVTAVITDQHKTSGKSTSYYCTVQLPDGRELDVEVSRSEYNAWQIGDRMDLQIATGCFGAEYAMDG